MSAKRHERTSARRAAVQVLYQSEILNQPIAAIVGQQTYLSEDGPLSSYACDLLEGVEGNKATIDEYLVKTSENWALERMPVVDLSVLRLAVYEMRYSSDVPVSVAINEAVDLAKDFGGEDDSHRFVNGILGKIAQLLEEENNER